MAKHEDHIARLCELQDEVFVHIDRMAEFSADCFCGRGGFWKSAGYGPESYRNDGKCIDYIVEAVREKMAKEKNAGNLQR